MNEHKVQEPPGTFGIRHLQTGLISISFVIAYAMRTSIAVALVAMTDVDSDSKVYDWTANQKSLILSSFLWGYAASQVPMGYLSGVWSAHKLFSIGFFLSGVVNLMTPFLADYADWIGVCVSRVLMGLVQACFLSCMHSFTSKWAPPLERSRLSSIAYSGTSLGNVVAMALTGVIAASSLGWQGVFYVYGIASIVMSVIFYFNSADSPALHPRISEEEKTYIMSSLRHEESQLKDKPRPPWTKIITSWPMWAIIVTHCGVNWGTFTLQTEIPSYVKSILKFGIAENGLISSLYFVTSWIGMLPMSWLADYAIRKGLSVSITRRISNTIGTWGPAFALIALCFVDTLGKIWPIMMLAIAGLLKSGIASGFNVNHIDLSPNFAGLMYAVSNCISTLISIVAPILCGAIVQDSVDPGPWHLVFYITAGILFFTNLVFIIFGRGKTQSWNDVNKRVSIISIYDPKILAMEP